MFYDNFNHDENKDMRSSNTLWKKINRRIGDIFAFLAVFLISWPVYAQEKMSKIDMLIGLHYGLSMIVPIAGAIMLLFLLIIFAFNLVSKATFLRWAFSIIIASAAFYISRILLYIA